MTDRITTALVNYSVDDKQNRNYQCPHGTSAIPEWAPIRACLFKCHSSK